jgi:photosystem II stability/assembly factor-like uncharacterized protein
MRLRYILIVCVLILTACNVSISPLPASSSSTEQPSAIPPTEQLVTPTPNVINAPLIESPTLIQIQMLNELDGWGVTETQIVRTNDGGVTWHNVTPLDVTETGSMVQTFILDNDNAWLQIPDLNNYPNKGFLYHTIDGGMTWTSSVTPFSGGDLNFIDANNGWMLADLGAGAGSNAVAVFQTTDGGSTWTQTYSNDPNNANSSDSLPLGGIKSDLVPLSMQTAWVSGVIYASGTVYLYRTDDGGHNWTQVALPLPTGAENFELDIDKDQMHFVSATDGFLAMRMAGDSTQTAVYVTHDAGNTWMLTPTLIPGAGASDFLSAQEGVIYNGEQFYVTRDAANTWNIVTPATAFGESFANMDFVNTSLGWVITFDAENHRSLYRTSDGGATWSSVIP